MMSLAYWYGRLAEERENLRRLNTCNTQLNSKQTEFATNQHLMTEPVLTATTWKGTLATHFDGIREDGILASYQDIQTTQFNSTFSVLQAKIEWTKNEIERIKAIIERLKDDD